MIQECTTQTSDTPNDAGSAGRALRSIREAMSATQRQAAERAGLSPSMLGRLERDQTFPRDPRYGRVARMYGRWLAEITDGHAV